MEKTGQTIVIIVSAKEYRGIHISFCSQGSIINDIHIVY
jgi:hypothetical protein